MITEEYLKRLGFTDFEHLDKSQRDLQKRLYAVRFVEEGCFLIRLVYLNKIWEVEQFKFEGEQAAYRRYFDIEDPDLMCILNTLFDKSIKSLNE